MTNDEAYRAIAQEILAFVGSREWDYAKGIYEVLGQSTSTKWVMCFRGQETRKGELPSREIASLASDAIFFLRNQLKEKTGARIWGLVFTLHPDGKFNIEYDYNKPEDY